MKLSLLLVFTITSCSQLPTRSISSVALELNNKGSIDFYVNGDKKKDPPIHSDLQASVGLDLENIKSDLERSLEDSQDLNNLDLQDVGVPDYKPAFYSLQSRISIALSDFFNQLDELNIRLKKDLSRIYSIDIARKKYQSPEWDQAFFDELATTYPKIDRYLKRDYKRAVYSLYTLNGHLDLPVKINSKSYKDIFKSKHKFDLRKTKKHCITKMCYEYLKKDISAWISLVHSIDKGLSFSNMKHTLKEPNKAKSKQINHLAIGIKDFMKKMIGIKLKDNKVYTNGSAALEYAKDISSSSIGVVSGILYMPALIFDKIKKFIPKISNSKKFIITNLKVDKVETYPLEDIVADYSSSINKLKVNLKNVAIGDEEIKQTLRASLKRHQTMKEDILYYSAYDKYLYQAIKKYVPSFFGFKESISFQKYRELILYQDSKIVKEVFDILRNTTDLKELNIDAVMNFGASNIKKYGLKNLKRFKVDDLNKYGVNNLKLYGEDNLKKYELSDLKKYKLEDINKYSLNNIKKFGIEEIKAKGLEALIKEENDSIEKYGSENIDKYGLKNLKDFGLENIKRYGLENLKKHSLRHLKLYGSYRLNSISYWDLTSDIKYMLDDYWRVQGTWTETIDFYSKSRWGRIYNGDIFFKYEKKFSDPKKTRILIQDKKVKTSKDTLIIKDFLDVDCKYNVIYKERNIILEKAYDNDEKCPGSMHN